MIREVVAATSDIQTVAGNIRRVSPAMEVSQPARNRTSPQVYLATLLATCLLQTRTTSASANWFHRSLSPSRRLQPMSAVSTQDQFTATVTGTSNTSVTWQVNEVVGGNSTVGTISTAGLFQAPATIPSPATVTITAVSAADGTTSGSAQVTIVGAGDAVTVVVQYEPSRHRGLHQHHASLHRNRNRHIQHRRDLASEWSNGWQRDGWNHRHFGQLHRASERTIAGNGYHRSNFTGAVQCSRIRNGDDRHQSVCS